MPLELTPLTLETLTEVKGGMVSAMLAKALHRMADDIVAAPDINEWREVQLTIRAKPVLEQLELAHVDTEFVVKGKVPNRVTSAVMVVRSTTNGARQLMFNIDAQDSPNQMTLLNQKEE